MGSTDAPSPHDRDVAGTTPSETAPPPPTGWVVPSTTAPPTSPRTRRAILIVSWSLAIVAAAFGALVAMGGAPGSDARRLGTGIGAFVSPFLFAVVLRWVVVRVMRGRPNAPVGVVRSQWVPLVALFIVVANLGGNLERLAPPAPVDPATALRVGPGFTLRPTDAATEQQIAAEYAKAEVLKGRYVIREVVGEDGSVSFLFVVDGGLREADISEAARGVGDASGIATRIEGIAGEQVALAIGTGFSIASWIEEPLALWVLAGDESTLRAVVESVLVTPRR
jgi:hypothetical protein